MKILLTIIAIILFTMPALAQEKAHGFDEQARDAASPGTASAGLVEVRFRFTPQ